MGDYIRDKRNEGLYRAPVVRGDGLGNYGDDGLGDWMSDLASKLPNPTDAQQKAEQLGDQFTNWARTQEAAIKKDAFKYFYLQGRELIGKYVTDPRVAAFQKEAGALYDSATGVYNALDNLRKSKGELDASGIVDTAMAAQTMVTALGSFAKYAGANAKVVDSFGGWASVGLGCVASMATTGIMGVVGCASSIMLKTMESPPMQWYSILGSSDHWPCVTASGVSGQPRAVLAENVQNTTAIQADALRLAAVLKHYYGINSTAELWGRIKSALSFGWSGYCGWGDSGYPLPPPLDPATGAFAGSASPATATTLADIALIFSNDVGSAQPSGAMFASSYGLPDRLFTTGQPHSEPLSWTRTVKTQGFDVRFSDARDVSVSIVESLAAAGRSNLANHKTLTIRKPSIVAAPVYGWIVVDELVNFFTAVTLQQITDDVAQAVSPIENAYLQSGLPVQHTVIGDGKTRWSLNATPIECNVTSLMSAVRNGNVEACREFAGLRLMAALSHIIMMYKWGSTSSVPCDLIASIPMYSDIRRTLLSPVDPRTVIRTGDDTGVFNTADGINDGQMSAGFVVGKWRDTPTGWHLGAWRGPEELASIIAGREIFYGPAKRAAWEAAQKDVLGGGSGQMLQIAPQIAPMTSTLLASASATKIMQMLIEQGKGPQLISTYKAEFKTNCERDGGYVVQDIDPYTKTLRDFCRPTDATKTACLESGGIPTWDPVNLYKCVKTAPSGGGAGGIVILAGAALLLAKFLK